MDTKRCPSCSRDMPADAQQCTSCAFDFTEPLFPVAVFPSLNRNAVWSLAASIVWVFGFGSVAAIVLGRRAQAEIAAARGRQQGQSLARWGMALGGVGLLFTVLFLLLLIVG